MIHIGVLSLIGALCSQPSQSASAPAATQATQPAASQPASERLITPFPGIRVIVSDIDPAQSRIELEAITCLDSGWLEQVACAPATREHESLMVVKAKPSHVHAALLLAGFEPGKPGRWTYENNKFGAIDPTGQRVALFVRYSDKGGTMREHAVGRWMRGQSIPDKPGRPFPDEPWTFGGSAFAPNTPDMGPGEHYVADMSGSIIGLVTFGDETIGFSKVLADQDAVQEPAWEANPETMPEPGTAVTIIIRKWPG